jgi:hypothetical protein
MALTETIARSDLVVFFYFIAFDRIDQCIENERDRKIDHPKIQKQRQDFTVYFECNLNRHGTNSNYCSET